MNYNRVIRIVLICCVLLSVVPLASCVQIKNILEVSGTPVHENYKSKDVYRYSSFNSSANYCKYYYSSTSIDSYKRDDDYLYVDNFSCEYVKHWIKSFKYHVTDFGELSANVDFDEESFISEGDSFAVKMTPENMLLSDIKYADFRTAELYYVSYEKNTVYAFRSHGFSFCFLNNSGGKKWESESFMLLNDRNALISATKGKGNKNEVEIVASFIMEHDHYYELNENIEFILMEPAVSKDWLDTCYYLDRDSVYPDIVIGFENDGTNGKPLFWYFHEYAMLFGISEPQIQDIGGFQTMRIETEYYVLYLWQNDEDYIRLVANKNVLKSIEELELVKIKRVDLF